MKYLATIEQGPTSFGAYLPGCVAVGDTREEAMALITDAVRNHLEPMAEHGETIPQPVSAAVEVEMETPAPVRW